MPDYNTSEQIHTDNNGVKVLHLTANDVPAGHHYNIDAADSSNLSTVWFQNGPVKQHGVNGATSEALLAILIHRTKKLDGNFPCDENKIAIAHLETALTLFEQRTKDRIARQVEGENKV